jgi:hypothetical protein
MNKKSLKSLLSLALVIVMCSFSIAQDIPTLSYEGEVKGYVATDAVLYDQTSGSGTNSLASQNFGTANDPFDCQAADDFVVPAGETWNIESVDAPGAYFNGVGPAVDFNVFFYSDAAGLPGTEVASVLNASYTDPGGLGSVSITFPSAVVLTEGTYWVSVQCNMEFAVGGQWGWLEHNPVGSESGWQNPGGGFGSPCTTWGYRVTDCAVGSAPFVDMAFALNGTIGGGQTARVQVIHNSADVLAGEVDVYIDGALALDNFAFRAATPYIDLPAGVTINIGIAPGNSGSANDTLKNFPVVLDPMETYVVFANGVLDPSQYAANPDGRSTAFTLFVKPMARETGLGSDVDFFVLHGSTDAPTVDVKAREAGNVTLVDDAAYSDITDYIQVPPADYTLDLYLSDGVTLVESFIAPLSGLGGGAAAVFASGFLDPSVNQNGAAFGIFAALPDGSVVEFVPGVVPVELSSFTANVTGSAVTLNWTTSTETNNQGFEIQRKTGNEFLAVGFVNGKGTTTEIQNYTFTDRNLNAGSYSYRLKQVDLDGSFEYSNIVEVDVAPSDFSLAQNYPNPFNPSTIITFNLVVDSKVTLTVFNTLGEEVTKLVNGNLNAGFQQIDFNASGLNSGVYFYQIQVNGIDGTSFNSVKKMILSK